MAELFKDTPGTWVPFTARTTTVFSNGTAFTGVFYRSSDGSTRSETGPANGEINSIAVRNMAEQTFYNWIPTKGWELQPLDMPLGKYLQPIPDAAYADWPIAGQAEGMNVIAMPQPDGIVSYLAPQLNYFAVRRLEPCTKPGATGCGFWASDIQIGEQPEELFKPRW